MRGPVRRLIAATVVTATCCLGSAEVLAQGRIGSAGQRGTTSRVGTTVPRPTAPATRVELPPDVRLTSELRFVPPVLPDRAVLWPFGLGWGSFGYVPLPWWNIGSASVPAYAPLVPSERTPTGGLQLDVEPSGAQVYVDGAYVGVAREFSGYFLHHLDLVAGFHVLTFVAPDYEPLIVDVMVVPGRTTPFRTTLARAYGR